MKGILYILVALVAGCGVVACSAGKDSAAASGEKNYDSLGPVVSAYFAAREADTVAGWGLVRCDGTMLFSDRFNAAPSAAVNGYFTVRGKNGYTVYKAAPEPTMVEGLDGLVHAGAMAYGLMPVTWKGKRIALVDGQGVERMELTAISGREIVKTAPYFIDGLLAVYTQDGCWGAVNTSGEMVLEPVYDIEPRFSERLAPVRRTLTEQVDSTTTHRRVVYYLVNSKGRVVFTFPEGMKPRSHVHGGMLAVELPSGQLAMMDTKGNIRQLPRGATRVGDFDNRYIVWCNASSRYGLVDVACNELIGPGYRSIHPADSDRMVLESFDGQFMLADSAGTPKVRFNGFDKVNFMKRPATGVVSPFLFIGEGFAGKVMLDTHGHRLGAGPFVDISADPVLLADGYVHTDFFNIQAAVHAMLSQLNERGWGDVALKNRMCALTDTLGERESTVRSLRFHSDSLYMLTVEAVAYSDRPPAIDSVTGEGRHVYRADTTSLVKYLRVEGAVPGNRFADMVQHVGAELVPMGYRAEKIRDEYAVYASDRMIVIVAPRPNLEGMYLYVMDRGFYDEAGERIIADAEKTFNSKAT